MKEGSDGSSVPGRRVPRDRPAGQRRSCSRCPQHHAAGTDSADPWPRGRPGNSSLRSLAQVPRALQRRPSLPPVVEQLDRGRKAALADPADGCRSIGHEEDPLGVVHPEPGAGRDEALREGRPGGGLGDVRPVDEGAPGPPGPAGTSEDEPDLGLEQGARPAVDHRPVGLDPHVARGPAGRCASRLVAQDRLGLGHDRRLDPGALLGHPAMELTVADRQPAELVERRRCLRVREFGHDLRAARPTTEPAAVQVHLAGQRDQPARRPAVGLERPTARAANRDREGRLEHPHEFGPQRLSDLGQGGIDRSLERAEIGMLGPQGHGQRDGMLHASPSSAGDLNNLQPMDGLVLCRPIRHRRLDAYPVPPAY